MMPVAAILKLTKLLLHSERSVVEYQPRPHERCAKHTALELTIVEYLRLICIDWLVEASDCLKEETTENKIYIHGVWCVWGRSLGGGSAHVRAQLRMRSSCYLQAPPPASRILIEVPRVI